MRSGGAYVRQRAAHFICIMAAAVPLMLAAATSSHATCADPNHCFPIDPKAIDSAAVTFPGRALSATPGDLTIACVKIGTPPKPDTNPTGMLTAQSASGTDAVFTVAPDTGCGLTAGVCTVGGAGAACSGCRKGNSYQCTVQPTSTTGDRPTFEVQVDVFHQQF
jgi:hypothetical protein